MKRFLFRFMSVVLLVLVGFFALSGCSSNPNQDDPEATGQMLSNFNGVKAIYLKDSSEEDINANYNMLYGISNYVLNELYSLYGATETVVSETPILDTEDNQIGTQKVAYPISIKSQSNAEIGTLNAVDSWQWTLTNANIASYKSKLTAVLVNSANNKSLDISTNITESAVKTALEGFSYFGLKEADIAGLKTFVKNSIIGSSLISTDNAKRGSLNLSANIMYKVEYVDSTTSKTVLNKGIFDFNKNGSINQSNVCTTDFKNYDFIVEKIIDEAISANLKNNLNNNTYFYNIGIQNFTYAELMALANASSFEEPFTLEERRYISLIYMTNTELIDMDYKSGTEMKYGFGFWGISTHNGENVSEVYEEKQSQFINSGKITFTRAGESESSVQNLAVEKDDEANIYALAVDFNNVSSFSTKTAFTLENDETPSANKDEIISTFSASTGFNSGILNALTEVDGNFVYSASNHDVLQIFFDNDGTKSFSFSGIESLLFEKI